MSPKNGETGDIFTMSTNGYDGWGWCCKGWCWTGFFVHVWVIYQPRIVSEISEITDVYVYTWSFTRAEISVPAAFRIWILKFEHFRPHSSRFLFLVDFIRFYVVIPGKKRLINGPIRMPSYMLIAATSPHVPLAVGVGVRSLCTSLPDLPLTRLGPLTRDDREMKAARNLEEITCNFHRRF